MVRVWAVAVSPASPRDSTDLFVFVAVGGIGTRVVYVLTVGSTLLVTREKYN